LSCHCYVYVFWMNCPCYSKTHCRNSEHAERCRLLLVAVNVSETHYEPPKAADHINRCPSALLLRKIAKCKNPNIT
jgi:hypothetical protein